MLNSFRSSVSARWHPLAREIGLMFMFKLAALFLLYAFFFSPSHRIEVTPTVMESAVFGASPDASARP